MTAGLRDAPAAASAAVRLAAWARAGAAVPAGGGRLLLREPDRGRYLVLNPAAASAFRGLREGEGPHALARRLARDLGVPDAVAAAWIEATLAGWRGEGRGAAGGERRPDHVPAAEPDGAEPDLDAVYRLGDAAVRLRCFDPGLARALAAAAAPARHDGPPAAALSLVSHGDGFALLREGAAAAAHPDRTRARWGALRAMVALGRPGLRWGAHLHAGAVADPRGGRALVLAGRSGAGKTTLTAALVASGLALLADDLVPLDAGAWQAWAVPLAMCVKAGGWPVLAPLFPGTPPATAAAGGAGRRHLWPGRERAADPGRGHPVAALLFPDRAAAGAPARLERLGTLEALGRLGATGSALPAAEADLEACLAWLAGVPAYRLACDDLGGAVALARSLLGAGPGPGAAAR